MPTILHRPSGACFKMERSESHESDLENAVHQVDPYLVLARKNNFADYGDAPNWVSVMIELKGPQYIASLKAIQLLKPFALQLAFCELEVPVVSGKVRTSLLSLLDLVPGIKRYELAEAFVPGRMPLRRPAKPAGSWMPAPEVTIPGGTTLRAVIDTGCPFAHRVFRKSNGTTAIRAIWDQDAVPDFGRLGRLPAYATHGYGAVLDRKWMDAAIDHAPGHSYSNEQACYASVGYGELDRRASHGAHVLGIFANGGCRESCNSQDDTLFVQLPRNVLSAPSRAALGKAIFDGLQWILIEAIRANASAMVGDTKFTNVVVNVSYSSSLGPHDGSSIFETAVSGLFDAALKNSIRLDVVFSAGNDFEERLHARIPSLKRDEPRELRWRIPPGNELHSLVEIWMPPSAACTTVNVILPSQEVLEIGPENSAVQDFYRTVTLVSGQWRAADGARLVLLQVGPGIARGKRTGAASGDYRILIQSPADVSSPIDAYISHAHGTIGYPQRSAKSHFVARPVPANTPPPTPSQGNSFVDSSGTLNGLSCFSAVTVVGSFAYEDYRRGTIEKPTRYTASGASRESSSKVCPEYSAWSEASPALAGIRGIGNYSAVAVRFNGTSVAAPQVARQIAGHSRIATSVCHPRLGDPIKAECSVGPDVDAMSTTVST